MKRKRFREEQIVRILKEAEAGQVPVVEICRKYAISEFTFYRWRTNFTEALPPAILTIYTRWNA